MRKLLLKIERKFEKLLPREQKVFPIFVIVCLFLVFQYILLSPILKKKTRLKIENDTLKNEVFSLNLKLKGMGNVAKSLDTLDNEVSKLIGEFTVLTNKIPSKDKLASILSHLAASEKIKFMVKEMDEKSYIENSRYTVIPFSVTVAGDYFNVRSFLISLENAEDRLLKIENVRITIEEGDSLEVMAYFTIEAYKIRSMDYLMELSKKEALEKEKEKEKKNAQVVN